MPRPAPNPASAAQSAPPPPERPPPPPPPPPPLPTALPTAAAPATAAGDGPTERTPGGRITPPTVFRAAAVSRAFRLVSSRLESIAPRPARVSAFWPTDNLI